MADDEVNPAKAKVASRVLHLDTLISKEACYSQVREFELLWGSSVNVTVEEAEKYPLNFDYSWAAALLLSQKSRWEYFRVVEGIYLRTYPEATLDWALRVGRVKARTFAELYIRDEEQMIFEKLGGDAE